ncbi:MAG TPA: TlyA family RNA methyltransferase [Acidimicrobiales bacterium]|nr:TlyA family RNA methyltransferase [Acidimicrobiales bacterium]
MVRRGLADSDAQARELIDAGRVLVSGAIAETAARRVAPSEPVTVAAPPPRYVSRAGFKLEGALDRFGIDPAGRVAVDVGSSTGGFTDCLLSRGAVSVTAIDVGTNQLHERLRAEPRVDVRERTDVRSVRRADLGDECDLVTVDVSFISLVGLAAHLVHLAGVDGELVVLVKPQFEATRREADRGAGVISDPDIWHRALLRTTGAFTRAGAGMMGVMVSPVRGASGNTEFLVHLRTSAPGEELTDEHFDALMAEVA